jgi:hypothetical protein
VALLVVGAVLAVTSLGLLGAGGTALWADQTQRDGDGFVTSDALALSTTTSALVTEPLDVTLEGAGDAFWLRRTLGTVRAEVQAPAGQEVFVGLARSGDVDRYLRGVAVDRVVDVTGDEVTYDRRAGSAVADLPADQDFWVASASGSGPLDLDWEVESGRWAVVVMDPDAEPGVAADVRVGATVPALFELAIGLIAAGGVLLAAGATLLVVAAAGARRTHPPSGPELPGPRAPHPSTPRTSAPYAPGPLL